MELEKFAALENSVWELQNMKTKRRKKKTKTKRIVVNQITARWIATFSP